MELHPIPIGGGSILGKSRNWTIREATATDVSNDDAVEVGDLLVEHKDNGVKHGFEKTE